MTGKSNELTGNPEPARLLRVFVALSIASIIAILLVAGLGISWIVSEQMVRDAESDAVAVGQAVFSQERGALLARNAAGGGRIAVAAESFDGLDRRMRKFLSLFNIYKIKVYSRDKTIVYSTDRTIIGKSDSGNRKLDMVLATGAVHSNLEKKHKVQDLVDEARIDVDVVEAYIPIESDGAIVGSFEIYVDVTKTRRNITRVVVQSLGLLSAILLVVFGSLYIPMRQGTRQLKQTQDQLRAMASTDMLTGIFNRRFLFTRIEEEYSRMKRERLRQEAKDSLAFLMIDIDHFKIVNDKHGHLAGDEILRQVTVRLKRRLRSYDVIGRYGGEEFLVMLPHTDMKDAGEIADRMHQSIRAEPFEVGKLRIPVTVSIGVTYSAGDAGGMLDAIRRADQGLYAAKHDGRDRVVRIPA